MTTYENGTIAITLEWTHATVRMIDHVPTGERPPYTGVGQITRLPCGVALLSGFQGEMSRAHCWLILHALLDQGFRLAYMERVEGHIAPFAQLVQGGDFDGLWRVELEAMRDRRKRKPVKSSEQPMEVTC